jgi:Trk K+ transport system NAD-binding subunit
LWHEFRRPILIFIFVTLVGGFVYGELHTLAGLQPSISLIDRPFTMVQLMVIETPPEYETTPTQWYLVIWWYLCPMIFVFIIGDGAADFARLFFNRNERRDAWREAVASTYRNHVIVLGAGHVGLRVVRMLHDLMGIDVVVIDNSPDAEAETVLSERKIPLIRGDGNQTLTLEKAGLPDAESFIACTGNDHANLDAIMRARSMNPNIRIVARIWDSQHSQQIKEFMRVQSVISSSEISAPVFAGLALGVELTQSLDIGGVAYSTMRLTVNRDSFMDQAKVGDLQRENNMDIVLHVPWGQSAQVQPDRDTVVRAGDTVVVFARHDITMRVASRNHFLK